MQGNVNPLTAPALNSEVFAHLVSCSPADTLDQPVVITSMRGKVHPRATGMRSDLDGGNVANKLRNLGKHSGQLFRHGVRGVFLRTAPSTATTLTTTLFFTT